MLLTVLKSKFADKPIRDCSQFVILTTRRQTKSDDFVPSDNGEYNVVFRPESQNLAVWRRLA